MFYVNTRVLEFWVMEITNIYDFLHLLNLIKIKLNMDFGGGFGICIYMPLYIYINEGYNITSYFTLIEGL
jgi:hypothetical protein